MLRKRSPLDNMARFQNIPPIAGGALRAGDTNKGWPGRPPADLTMRSREVYERLHKLSARLARRPLATRHGASSRGPA
jgi:hypothetical protein